MTKFGLKHYIFILLVGVVICAALLIFQTNQAGVERDNSTKATSSIPKVEIVDIAIIGSGPAGVAAAQYSAGNKFNIAIFNGPNSGGYAATLEQINNWPGKTSCAGDVLMQDLRANAEKVNARFVDETVTKIDYSTRPFALTTDAGNTFKASTIIIATGTERKKPKIPGGSEYWGRGISPCSLCDSTSHINKHLVVVGNNYHVINETVHLAKTAQEIYLFVSDKIMEKVSQHQFPANVHLMPGKVSRIIGNEKTVTGIEYLENGEHKTMETHGVFVSLGDRPNSSICQNGGPKTDKKGYIQTAPHSQATTISGIFAAGDVCQPHIKQAVIADADGLRAAIEATKFINKKN